MVRAAIRHGAIAVGQCPGDEDAALAADVHAIHGEVKAGNHAANGVRKLQRLGVTHLGLIVRPHDGLAVRADDWLRVLIPRVKDYAIGSAPTLVFDMPHLLFLAEWAGAELDVLILEREGGFHDSVRG